MLLYITGKVHNSKDMGSIERNVMKKIYKKTFLKLLDNYITLRYSIYRSTSIAVRYIAVHTSEILS